MIYIGIDPGLTGAVAVIDGKDVSFHDTPTFQDGKANRLDAAECAKILGEVSGGNACVAFLEKVGAGVYRAKGKAKQAQMGSVSAFNFGEGFGIWQGTLAALKIPYARVTPQAWKKTMMAGEAKEKDASRIVARRLFPVQCEESLSRKKDHGRADALLIAEYGRRMTERK